MRQNDGPINLGRGLLAGLLTGIINAVLIVFFVFYYRKASSFYTFEIVMPFTIFVVCPLFDLGLGGIYYLFVTHLQKGSALFRVIFILLTLLGAALTGFTGEVPGLHGYRGLLFGIELIGGLLSAILIPFLAQHPRLFLTASDIKGEE